jgi:hypothetical protein
MSLPDLVSAFLTGNFHMILVREPEFKRTGMSWRTPVLECYLNMFEIITVSKC